jgi:hypothetical protein
MNQNKVIIFFILVFLGFAYLIFSFMVFLTRGKKASLIKRKLKTGTHIIILTGLLSTAGLQGCIPPVITCYDPLPQNLFYFSDTNKENQLLVDGLGDRIIYGEVSNRYADAFLFQVFDQEGVQCDQGSVLPVDGIYDSSEEDVVIDLSDTLAPGLYDLLIYQESSLDYPVFSIQVLIS